MSKLPESKKFLDFSDYARYPAQIIVQLLIKTRANSIFYTALFFLCGLAAVILIIDGSYLKIAAVLLLLKSMFDAADGEVARRKNRPSYVGRYLDSICDFIINALLFFAIGYSVNIHFSIILFTLILFQLQGSLYNYYYVIKRYQCDGDRTSRINENKFPDPFPYDNLKVLHFLHFLFKVIYGWQDKIVQMIDEKAQFSKELPNWFLTMVSVLGLGFQLLIIAVCLFLGELKIIFAIFIFPLTLYMFILILIRKTYLH